MRNFLKQIFPFSDEDQEPKPKIETIKTTARGISILKDPLMNKGSAFTEAERVQLGLTGLLPSGVTTLENQVARTYEQYQSLPTDLAKNLYLTALHDRNEVLFYKLFMLHMREMMPIVYDPTVGLLIQQYSHRYQRPRGVYLSIDAPEKIEESFRHFGLGPDNVDLLVATDAEEILGIGDWGVGGIEIAVGKLAVYTAVAGINPARAIPVMLDVGTNNETLLNDPLYMGYRHSRIRGDRYDAFIDAYVKTARKLFPKALLHWEDFGPSNGRRILMKYRNQFPTFNDDMQGTGAITIAGIMNALKIAETQLSDARVIIFGAGTAGCGIADQLRDLMIREGVSTEKALLQFWLVDREGLLVDTMGDKLRDYQKPYARKAAEVARWKATGPEGKLTLADVVREVHPVILIGTSTAPHTFTEAIIKDMAVHVNRPIIFPLSNPTSLAEADPTDLIQWTQGRALVATGSPFPPVIWNGVMYTIGQANNALLYPGLGLGTIVSRARQISDGMFWAAAEAVANSVKFQGKGASLLPSIDELRSVSATVAVAVAKTAKREGLAEANLTDVVQQVQEAMWQPVYPKIMGVD